MKFNCSALSLKQNLWPAGIVKKAGPQKLLDGRNDAPSIHGGSAIAAEAIDGWDLDREEYMINGDLTADMIARALDNLHATTVRETIAEIEPEGVMMWANCLETERGEDGNWWIAGPQTGHWLKPHEQAGLALWAVTQ